jgi:hypothetical protein
MELTIEKGVPMPAQRIHAAGTTATARGMSVGDSIFFNGRKSSSMGSVVSTWKKATGFTFTCRNVEGGSRIWRVS